jgi:hypothetical protein
MNVAVAILRLQEGLDCSEILADIDDLMKSKSSEENLTITNPTRSNSAQSYLLKYLQVFINILLVSKRDSDDHE